MASNLTVLGNNQALAWIGSRSRDYQLVYIDPLIADRKLRHRQLVPRLRSWVPPWAYNRPEKRASTLLESLVLALGVRWSDQPDSFFDDEEGLADRFKASTETQRRGRDCIKRDLAGLGERHKTSVQALLDKPFTERTTSKQNAGSLVVVDGALIQRACARDEIQDVIERDRQALEGSERTIEAILADRPPQMLMYNDPFVRLMVGARAFYYWTEPFMKVLGIGWHPFARIVGLYQTVNGGRPYVNVLAIMLRPSLTVQELLWPTKVGDPSLVDTLSGLRTRDLAGAIVTVRNIRQAESQPPTPKPNGQRESEPQGKVGTASAQTQAAAGRSNGATASSTMPNSSATGSGDTGERVANAQDSDTSAQGGTSTEPSNVAPAGATAAPEPLVQQTEAAAVGENGQDSGTPGESTKEPSGNSSKDSPKAQGAEPASGSEQARSGAGSTGPSPAQPPSGGQAQPPDQPAQAQASADPTTQSPPGGSPVSQNPPPLINLVAWDDWLLPLYLAQAICKMNGVSAKGLQTEAPRTHRALELYLRDLRRLAKELDAAQLPCHLTRLLLDPKYPVDIAGLLGDSLPEPKEGELRVLYSVA